MRSKGYEPHKYEYGTKFEKSVEVFIHSTSILNQHHDDP